MHFEDACIPINLKQTIYIKARPERNFFGTWTWREHFFSWWGFFLTVSLGMPPAAASSPRAEQTPPHELQLGTGPDCHGCGLHYSEQSILLRRRHQHWSNHLLLVLKIIYVVNFFSKFTRIIFTLKFLKFFVIPDYRGYSFQVTGVHKWLV